MEKTTVNEENVQMDETQKKALKYATLTFAAACFVSILRGGLGLYKDIKEVRNSPTTNDMGS